MNEIQEKLYQAAIEARKNSRAKYSNFRVGAALLTKEGKIFTGTNIESSSYSLTICAERTAIFKALSEGYDNITHILVLCESDDFCRPCGACRQIISDYAKNAEIILANTQKKFKVFSPDFLLPLSFSF